MTKNYHPLRLFYVVIGKIFEEHVNNRLVDYLLKSGLFLTSHVVSGLLVQLPADLLTVVFGRTTCDFKKVSNSSSFTMLVFFIDYTDYLY